MEKLRKIKKYLPIIGIIIFIYILFRLNLSEIFREISNAKINLILIAVLLLFVYFTNETLKWFSIARMQMMQISFIEALKINIMCHFYGFLTPAKLGTVIRAEYLRKYNNNKLGKGISNYILDKILDMTSLVLFALVFSFVFKKILPSSYLYYFFFMLIILVASLLVFIDQRRSKAILRIFYRKLIPEKDKRKVREGFYSFYQDMPKKRYFILFSALNLLNWAVLYLSVFFIGLSLGVNAPFTYFLAILPIATLVGQIPVTINGLGTREAASIALFGLFGIGAEKIFSMSLISLFISGVIPAIIGGLLTLKNIKKT